MAAKRKSLAEELAELVDPAPLTFDPEHTDLNEATVARLADYKEEGSEEGETSARLRLRAGAALQELSEDPRYSGRAVSRRSLEEEEEESGECTCGAALVASGYSNGFVAVSYSRPPAKRHSSPQLHSGWASLLVASVQLTVDSTPTHIGAVCVGSACGCVVNITSHQHVMECCTAGTASLLDHFGVKNNTQGMMNSVKCN